MQIDVGELLRDEIEQACLVEAIDLDVKVESLEDVPHLWREALQIATEVFTDVILVAHQLLQVEGVGVVEMLPGLLPQERFGIQPGFLTLHLLCKHSRLGRLENTVEPA